MALVLGGDSGTRFCRRVGEGSEMSFISENISRSGAFWILILL